MSNTVRRQGEGRAYWYVGSSHDIAWKLGRNRQWLLDTYLGKTRESVGGKYASRIKVSTFVRDANELSPSTWRFYIIDVASDLLDRANDLNQLRYRELLWQQHFKADGRSYNDRMRAINPRRVPERVKAAEEARFAALIHEWVEPKV
jgi:hypothetical protein